MDDYLEEEFAEPYNLWKTTPNPQTSAGLLKAVNPVITAALRTYGTQKSPTLQSRAKIMALDAIKRYDPTKAKLRTHLMFQLQGLRRYAAREQQILSVPEQVALDLNYLRESENELKDLLGRDPSTQELADHMKIPVKRIEYIRKSKPSFAEGGLMRSTDDGEDVYAPSVERKNALRQWYNFVYNDLQPTDQLIMEHTLGLHGKPVLQNYEIAKRLGISPGAVSQRKARIQAKLNLRDDIGVI